MSAQPITSADEFTKAISDVVRRYVLHLEPSAEYQLYDASLKLTGERLNVDFHKHPQQTPFISFTLQSIEAAQPADEPRGGIFGRG